MSRQQNKQLQQQRYQEDKQQQQYQHEVKQQIEEQHANNYQKQDQEYSKREQEQSSIIHYKNSMDGRQLRGSQVGKLGNHSSISQQQDGNIGNKQKLSISNLWKIISAKNKAGLSQLQTNFINATQKQVEYNIKKIQQQRQYAQRQNLKIAVHQKIKSGDTELMPQNFINKQMANNKKKKIKQIKQIQFDKSKTYDRALQLSYRMIVQKRNREIMKQSKLKAKQSSNNKQEEHQLKDMNKTKRGLVVDNIISQNAKMLTSRIKRNINNYKSMQVQSDSTNTYINTRRRLTYNEGSQSQQFAKQERQIRQSNRRRSLNEGNSNAQYNDSDSHPKRLFTIGKIVKCNPSINNNYNTLDDTNANISNISTPSSAYQTIQLTRLPPLIARYAQQKNLGQYDEQSEHIRKRNNYISAGKIYKNLAPSIDNSTDANPLPDITTNLSPAQVPKSPHTLLSKSSLKKQQKRRQLKVLQESKRRNEKYHLRKFIMSIVLDLCYEAVDRIEQKRNFFSYRFHRHNQITNQTSNIIKETSVGLPYIFEQLSPKLIPGTKSPNRPQAVPGRPPIAPIYKLSQAIHPKHERNIQNSNNIHAYSLSLRASKVRLKTNCQSQNNGTHEDGEERRIKNQEKDLKINRSRIQSVFAYSIKGKGTDNQASDDAQSSQSNSEDEAQAKEQKSNKSNKSDDSSKSDSQISSESKSQSSNKDINQNKNSQSDDDTNSKQSEKIHDNNDNSDTQSDADTNKKQQVISQLQKSAINNTENKQPKKVVDNNRQQTIVAQKQQQSKQYEISINGNKYTNNNSQSSITPIKQQIKTNTSPPNKNPIPTNKTPTPAPKPAINTKPVIKQQQQINTTNNKPINPSNVAASKQRKQLVVNKRQITKK